MNIYIQKILSIGKWNLNTIIFFRDIKLENILVNYSEKEGYKVKLIDFGMAATFNEKDFLSSRCGSCFYIAPEVLNKRYNEKCDIWSVGVISYALYTGIFPFDLYGKSNDDIIRTLST